MEKQAVAAVVAVEGPDGVVRKVREGVRVQVLPAAGRLTMEMQKEVQRLREDIAGCNGAAGVYGEGWLYDPNVGPSWNRAKLRKAFGERMK